MLVLLCVLPIISFAQDVSATASDSSGRSFFFKEIRYSELAVPVGLITYGILARESPFLKNVDEDIRDKLSKGSARKIKLDDFSRFAGTA